jgi:hypothetical protein
MDTFLTAMLQLAALTGHRQDDAVARQGVMNHQTAAHLMDLSFIRDATEMSIPESYAVQGLAASHLPRDAASLNLAAQTPKDKA